jgi:phosphohistidine phosphatase
MNLYLMRHGLAAEPPEWKGADRDRPLTDDGVKKMKKTAKGMHALGLDFDWILTSPYRRAYETAQIVAEEFGAPKKLRITKSLSVDADLKALVRHLALDFRSWESVLLVGHEPSLSHLISLLAAGGHLSGEFKKGSLCKLSADSLTLGPCARLEWLMTSKLLRASA